MIELLAINDQGHFSSRMDPTSCNYNFKGDRQLVMEYYQPPGALPFTIGGKECPIFWVRKFCKDLYFWI